MSLKSKAVWLALVMAIVLGIVATVQARVKFLIGGNYFHYRIEYACEDGIVFTFAYEVPDGYIPPSAVQVELAEPFSFGETATFVLDEDALGLGDAYLFSGRYVYYFSGWSADQRAAFDLTLKWDGATPPGAANIYVDKIFTTFHDCYSHNSESPYDYSILHNDAFQQDLYRSLTDPYDIVFPQHYTWSEPIGAGSCISSTLTVDAPDDELFISQLDVALFADLDAGAPRTEFRLTSPRGTTVSLFANEASEFYWNYGSRCEYIRPGTPLIGDPTADLIFSDTSRRDFTDFYSDGTEYTYRPSEPLYQFRGEYTAGEWTLDICSEGSSGEVIGYLHCWYLDVEARSTQRLYLPTLVTGG